MGSCRLKGMLSSLVFSEAVTVRMYQNEAKKDSMIYKFLPRGLRFDSESIGSHLRAFKGV